MKHEYYQYNAEEILSKGPKFPLIIMKDNAEVFKSMADEMADTIVEHNAKGEKTVFICPVGPVGQSQQRENQPEKCLVHQYG